jgi:hypothetical protein
VPTILKMGLSLALCVHSFVVLAQTTESFRYVDRTPALLNNVEERDYKGHLQQFGVVIPAFSSPDGYDKISTFVYREVLRTKFRNWVKRYSPIPSKEPKGTGSGLAYFVPRPLEMPSQETAVALARINSMQAAIWGTVEFYSVQNGFDGYLINTTLTYSGDYQDFRTEKLEYWNIRDQEYNFSVGLPRENIELPPYFVEKKIYDAYKNGKICYRRPNDGRCFEFGPGSKTQIRSLDEKTGRIEVTEFGKRDVRYSAKLPKELFATNSGVGYAAMFIAYSRGDWDLAIQSADAVIGSTESDTAMQVDALLFKGASLFRKGENGLKEIQWAKKISPRSQIVSRYLVLANYQLLRAKIISISDFDSVLKTETEIAGKPWLDRAAR